MYPGQKLPTLEFIQHDVQADGIQRPWMSFHRRGLNKPKYINIVKYYTDMKKTEDIKRCPYVWQNEQITEQYNLIFVKNNSGEAKTTNKKTQAYIHWATGVNNLEGFILNYQNLFLLKKNDSKGIRRKGLLFYFI